MLCVCPPPNQLVHFHEIQQGGHAVECDLSAIHFNPTASIILKWQTFIFLKWMQN
jgi:hypothetical protein